MLRERIQSILCDERDYSKPRHRRKEILLLVCFCCVLPLFAITCATKPYVADVDEPLYGTWVNEEYATLGLVRRDSAAVKYVYTADGKFFLYCTLSAAEPVYEGRLAFEEKWVDGRGNVYYKAVKTWKSNPYDCHLCPPCYVLFRVNAAGDVLETVSNQLKYPEEFSHYAGWYMVHYRQ
jgi:hypothetical protein